MSVAAYSRYEHYSQREWSINAPLPTHWRVKALKHGAAIVLGKMLCSENKGGYHLRPYLKSKNIQWLSVDTSSVDEMWFSPQELRQYRLSKNDLILSEGGEVGKACIWNDELPECYIQNSAHKVTMDEGSEPEYFLYQMYALGKHGSFDAAVNRVSIAHLTYEKLSNIYFAFPPPKEQRAIATFLDEKCAKLDEAVRIKEEQIRLLHERRQILIQQAVTRGLNPDAPMKDSGIDWIGQIPEHWKVQRNFTLFREVKNAGNADLPVLSVSIHSGVSREELSAADNIRSIVKIEDRTAYKEVLPGDIAYNMMRAWQGGIGAVHTHGMVSPAYVVARPTDAMTADYFELLYRTAAFIKQMDANSKGITDFRKRLYWDDFRDLLTIVPPETEQRQINQHADDISHKIDKAVSIKEDQIAVLKEYKTTLINAAVTGKIKVI